MSIEESRRYFENTMKWRFKNVQVLDERTWVARATTTHLAARGEPEHTFGVLVEGYDHLTFSLDILPPLAEWCNQNRL